VFFFLIWFSSLLPVDGWHSSVDWPTILLCKPWGRFFSLRPYDTPTRSSQVAPPQTASFSLVSPSSRLNHLCFPGRCFLFSLAGYSSLDSSNRRHLVRVSDLQLACTTPMDQHLSSSSPSQTRSPSVLTPLFSSSQAAYCSSPVDLAYSSILNPYTTPLARAHPPQSNLSISNTQTQASPAALRPPFPHRTSLPTSYNMASNGE
jgi:hypothetical protein